MSTKPYALQSEIEFCRVKRTCKQRRLFNLVSRECDGEYYQWHDEEMPNFCPNCGAKVMSE